MFFQDYHYYHNFNIKCNITQSVVAELTINLKSYYFIDSPVVVSRAHFLYGDQSLLNNVEGLKPDPSKHEFEWLIDPVCLAYYKCIYKLILKQSYYNNCLFSIIDSWNNNGNFNESTA